MLFPLSEAGLFSLDLFRESLPKTLLFLLELGVIKFPRSSLAEFTSLHLLLTIVLVVELLGGRDKIQHVSANQKRPQFSEVAVVLVLDFGNSPEVFSALDDSAVGGLDVFG
jgi:hypothetical protein